MGRLGYAIETATSADAVVAFEHTFAQMAGVRSKPPLFDAKLRTKRNAPARDLEFAPSAEISPISASIELTAICASA